MGGRGRPTALSLTGAYLAGQPSIYDHSAFDNTLGKTWVQIGCRACHLGGQRQATGLGRQQRDRGGAIDQDNTRAVKNRIALVIRGTCTFVTEVLNAQNAGAVGVIVVENVTTTPPADLGGSDPSITIPAVRITLADGITLLHEMDLTPSNRSSGVVARLGLDLSQLAGADKDGRVMLYTPRPFQGGSSVSHWDTSANRNLLMEPAINADLTQFLVPPYDLTQPMFKDIGW